MQMRFLVLKGNIFISLSLHITLIVAHPKIPQIRKIELAVKSDTGGG